MIMKDISLHIDSSSLAERAASKMEELIQNQVFKPGDKLPNEYELSEMLSVGRSTVREAIKILESRHVLKIRRGYGTFVCQHVGVTEDPFGLRFISERKKLSLDLSEMRMLLEPNIAKLAAQNATPYDIEKLQTVADEVAVLIRQGANYAQKDMELHTCIAKSTGNMVMPRIIPIICNGIQTFIEITNFKKVGSTIIMHQQIVDAIRVHDGDAAFAAMEKHIEENRTQLMFLPDD